MPSPEIKCSIVGVCAGIQPYSEADELRVVLTFTDVFEDGTTEDRWSGLTSQAAKAIAQEILMASYELDAYLAKHPRQEAADAPA